MFDNYSMSLMEYVMLREKATYLTLKIEELNKERAEIEATLVEYIRRAKLEAYGKDNSGEVSSVQVGAGAEEGRRD